MTDAKAPTDRSGASALKRKATFVPDSMLSYLTGALKTDFAHLKSRIEADSSFVSVTKHLNWTKAVLEELFRYVYLLADTSSDGVMKVAPSHLVEKALRSLLLDPVFYFQVCDAVLSLQGQDEVQPRVLPHNAVRVQGEEAATRSTLASYKQVFGEDPPATFWTRTEVGTVTTTGGSTAVADVPLAGSSPDLSLRRQAAVSPAAGQDDNRQITIKIRNKSGDEIFLRVKRTTRMCKVMNSYADRRGLPVEDLRFLSAGENVSGDMTAETLDLQENDTIDVIRAPPAAGKTVTLSFESPSADVMTITIDVSAKMRSAMQDVADAMREDLKNLRFIMIGMFQQIYPSETPHDLNMDDKEIIHVMLAQRGC